ncbi:DUF1877 family protein [Streptomyces sp. NPDC127190]|uniref:DUF1877 family protein n=1 Tax=unclassified Streptomyces TaxID=2593676 RepID=UPI00362BB556
MTAYLRLRAVPPPALRNSATWIERLFEGGSEAVRHRTLRHREEVLDERYLDQERLYAGTVPRPATAVAERPQAQVVLGGRPLYRTDPGKPPFLVLTAAQTRRVAAFLATADFDALWLFARDALLPRYGGASGESETWGAFAAGHRELTAFYTRTAEAGDAVVKRLAETGV